MGESPKLLSIKHGHVTSEDGILDASDLVQSLGSDTIRQWMLKHITTSRVGKIMMKFKSIDFEPDGNPVYAQIQWGRWVVNCECGGQENVSKGEPIFFCMSCFNAGNDKRKKNFMCVRQIIFPSDADDIEKELMKRSSEHRHWLKDETLADLEAQTEQLKRDGE